MDEEGKTLESTELSPSSKSSPTKNILKDDPWNCDDTDQMESSDACWDSKLFDSTFIDENQKVFQWDDRGALEALKIAEAKLLQGKASVGNNDAEQFLAAIDWDTRWSCNLPSCAKGSATEKKKKSVSGKVIIGLPDAREHLPRSATPSLKVPLDFVPVPTGWEESVETRKICEKSHTESEMPAANFGAEKADPPSQDSWRPASNAASLAVATESGLPEDPTSYQHIIPSGWGDIDDNSALVPSGRGDFEDNSPLVPSGWGDVEDNPPLVPSGWGDVQNNSVLVPPGRKDSPLVPSGWGDEQDNSALFPSGWGDDEEPRADAHMHRAENGWSNFASQGADRSNLGYGNFWLPVESGGIYGNANPGKHQDFYTSYKYEYRKPKRGSDHNYESSGRKNLLRHGRPNLTMQRVNHDVRLPRVNRWEHSKSQWQVVSSLNHESQASLMRSPGGPLATSIDV